jgi:hypothetical protein
MLPLMFWRLIVSLAVLGVATTASALDGFDVWHVRNASPTVHHLKAVTYGVGRFIAVGDQGTMVTSSNGTDWSTSSPFGTNDLNTIVYVENRFLVGGHNGLLRWSQDGVSWTSASVPVTNDVTAIGFGRGKLFTNGVYVASVAIPYSSAFRIMNSDDGENWTLQTNTILSPQPTVFAIGNDRFVASSWVSFSGSNWFSQTTESGLVAFGNGLFVMPKRFDNSSNGITLLAKTSTDAERWYPLILPNGNGNQPVSACFSGGQFITTGGPGLIATSVDGTNWVTHFTQIDAVLRSVAHGNGTFVAVGDRGVILTSSNSTDWVRQSTTGITLQAAAPADDGFVAVGVGGTAVTSEDGVRWQEFKLPTTNNLRDVIRANGKYVAVGANGVILSGETATNFTPRVSGTTEQLDGVAFGNQMFVAVGGRETIISSPDGIAWTIRNVGASNRLQTITYGANRFVTGPSRFQYPTNSMDL